MERITANDFAAWRESPVTKAFFAAAMQRIYDAAYNLTITAGMEPNQDNYTRGFIAAYRELEGFRIDDLDDGVVEE